MCNPCADQRGFSKAGGGRDEGQRAVQARVQPRDQPWAGDCARAGRGDKQLGGYQGWNHTPSIDHAVGTQRIPLVGCGREAWCGKAESGDAGAI